MRLHLSRWLVCAAFGAPFVGSDAALAQPAVRDHRHGVPTGPATPAADAGPTAAPPPLREEKHDAARAGFVWIEGQWDWKAGKWDWTPGHWEREHAGKHWRPRRWEQKDGHWLRVEGGWDVGAATPPPATTPPATTPPPSTTPPPATTPPPPPGGWPTAAPPPPRAETHDPTRAGFVWIEGQWDWKDNNWSWVAGHWEREQTGKRWRPHRWEQHDGHWARVEGGWEDGAAPVPPAPPDQTGMAPHHEHHWKLDRPVVSSYWPVKGKAGSKVIIRGKNFPNDAQVLLGGNPVTGAKIGADKIVFVIPAAAASGAITVRAGGRRELPVGAFEVAATYDPVAEQKRIEEEQRKAAEAAWNARQTQLAKDRAAREALIKQRREDLERTREERRAKRVAEIQAKWNAAFLADADTQAELTLHAQRVAEIERMRDIVDINGNAKLAVRIEIAQTREDQRHQQRMDALHTSFQP
jgi:hypothetical protein